MNCEYLTLDEPARIARVACLPKIGLPSLRKLTLEASASGSWLAARSDHELKVRIGEEDLLAGLGGTAARASLLGRLKACKAMNARLRHFEPPH
jgi:hypothetical protein